MIALGIDIGSRFIKAVIMEKDEIKSLLKEETSYDPLDKIQRIIGDYNPSKIVATGYGRYLLDFDERVQTITEIKAFAMGVKKLIPTAKTIIDIGGQDTKIISLSEEGKVKKFEMNDKCAAGTGRFLEIMASALGYNLEEFGQIKYKEPSFKISSMCTVFAESEVITLISKGVPREEIILALHQSVAKKIITLLKRVSLEREIVFVGGCAHNSLLKEFIEKEIGFQLIIPKNFHYVGAIGAALMALNQE